MKKLYLFVLFSVLSEGILTLQAQNTNIAGLYNTGQGQIAAGQPALHYVLVSAPGGLTNVYVSNPIPSPWNTASFPSALWLGAAPDATVGVAIGNYDYRLTFIMQNSSGQALNPLTAHIQGIWGVDNYGVLQLNGTSVGTAGTLSPFDGSGFTTPSSFDITTGFVAGINTLDFIVNNLTASPNPSGLIVQFTFGTAQLAPIPEPSVLALSQPGSASLDFGAAENPARNTRFPESQSLFRFGQPLFRT